MNHPGVKSLFDRICKTNGLKQPKPVDSDELTGNLLEKLSSNKSPNDSLIIEDSKPLMQPLQKLDTLTNSTQSCKLLGFKEQLRQRMKEKRQQIRKEEEEDERIDEEYHEIKKNNDDNENKDQNDLDDSDIDEKIDDDKDQSNLNDDDSDTDFKLNLNDEDSDQEESKKKISKKSKNVYDFDEEEDENNRKEIMSTNTIPSNQLIKNPKRTQSFMNMDDLVVINKQNILDEDTDELSRESFKEHHNDDSNQDKSGSQEKDGNEEEVFDELAMLCSGQFKSSNTKKIDQAYLSQLNQDLFSADDGEAYEQSMKNKPVLSQIEDNSNSNPTDLCETDQKDESVLVKIDDTNKNKIDEDYDENEDKILSNSSNKSSSSSKKRKVDEMDDNKDNSDNEDNLEKQGFFDEEAELSGSERESDEDFDGDSDDDKSILFSGDEDQLPSNTELKDQLEKIFLKDQLDRDKQELRLFKEMYLKDGELDEKDKNSRRKQFRWKHLDNDNDYHNNSSSDEDEDEEENDDNQDINEKNEDKIKEKSKKFAKKLLDKRNWRSIRHEREQLIDSKNKKDLLSDHENDQNDNDEYSNSSSSQSKDFYFSSSNNNTTNISSQTNQLIKKGQLLLKQKQPSETTSNANKSETLDHLKKFSFLNRDKTYLNRLSNYVNKNIYGAGSSSGSKSNRNNMMVFSSIDINTETNTSVDNKDDLKKVIHSTTSTTIKSIKVTNDGRADAKRIKIDNCESIFNHL